MEENKYTHDTDRKLTQTFLKPIRKCINNWASQQQSFPDKNLGDLIEISEVRELYYYRLRLKTEQETRSVRAKSIPYKGEAVDPKTIFSIKEVKPWDYDLERPKTFKDASNTYSVGGSATVDICSYCKGAGKNVCSTCGGNGKVSCGTCGSSGKVRCSECNGKGRVEYRERCSSCNGRGEKPQTVWDEYHKVYATRTRPCPECNGQGGWTRTKSCPTCSGSGKVRCSTCSGSGKVVCRKCSGTGQITCSTCEGYKKIKSYYVIDQENKALTKGGYFGCMPGDELNNIIKCWEQNDFELIDTFESKKGPLKVDVSNIDHPVSKSILDLLVGTEGTNDKRTLFQTLTVEKTVVWRVKYTYSGRDYTLYLTESGAVSALHSPVTHFAQGQIAEIKNQLKSRRLYDAAQTAQNLEALASKDNKTAFRILNNGILKKMRADYRFGAYTGIMLIMVASVPFLQWYYLTVGFTAPWCDIARISEFQLFKYLPYIYAAMGGIFPFWIAGRNKSYARTESFIGRFSKGFFVGMLNYIVGMLIVAALHCLILPFVWNILLSFWGIIAAFLD